MELRRETQRGSRSRAVALWTALPVLVGGVVAAGVWGLAQPQGASRNVLPTVGEFVPVPGGLVRVDGVTHLPDNPLKMSGPGMAMPMSPGPDYKPLPKGFHRFAVEVTLAATSAPGIRFRPPSFRVAGIGLRPGTTTSRGLTQVFVPDRGSYSQTLEFEAPMTARRLVLQVRGAAHPIRLGLRAMPTRLRMSGQQARGMKMTPGMPMLPGEPSTP